MILEATVVDASGDDYLVRLSDAISMNGSWLIVATCENGCRIGDQVMVKIQQETAEVL